MNPLPLVTLAALAHGGRALGRGQLPELQPVLGVHPGLGVGGQDGGAVGPAQPQAEAALLRVAQGRDLPGAVVAAQRDHPRLLRHRPQAPRLGPLQDRGGAGRMNYGYLLK